MSETADISRLAFLVVEDQGFQRWATGNLLERLGARRVVCVGDGREALAVLAEPGSDIDVVVSDLDMPGMDGMELIRHMATFEAAISVVLASGLESGLIDSVSALGQAHGLPVLGSVQKPVTEKKLRAVLGGHRPAASREGRKRRVFTGEEAGAALARGEIAPHYQPKVDLVSGAVVGFEALARWYHPQLGLVGAGEFVPVLEAAGRVGELTEVILDCALRDCAVWNGGGQPVTVAVNLSAMLFDDVGIVERMRARVAAQGLEPALVTMEVTESAMAVDQARALEILARLRMQGFGLSIDDYGTGYSSLQQLSRIAFTELKVDRSFVRDAAVHRPSLVVLESSLEIARKLGIKAVAEGVETRREADLLRSLKCDMAQGFHFGAPMAAADAGDLLRGARVAG
jgi:EAL domain-containing protein (putative c-di-GMP-specific phosphodiesterase class I)/FixJ family two-component response regulator